MPIDTTTPRQEPLHSPHNTNKPTKPINDVRSTPGLARPALPHRPATIRLVGPEARREQVRCRPKGEALSYPRRATPRARNREGTYLLRDYVQIYRLSRSTLAPRPICGRRSPSCMTSPTRRSIRSNRPLGHTSRREKRKRRKREEWCDVMGCYGNNSCPTVRNSREACLAKRKLPRDKRPTVQDRTGQGIHTCNSNIYEDKC